MAPDPSSIFGGLYRACIRDEYVADEKVGREGAILVILGIGSSVLTAYALSLVGIFV
jgi:hypothetical protein